MYRPIARELLDRGELYAFRLIRGSLPFRPGCRADTPTQFVKFRFREIYVKQADRIRVGCLPAAFLCAADCRHGSHSIPLL